ncbi:cleavage and polyadenylation specificity factor subunit 6-like isoform X2 [Biomphalaria glabrata]|nr:cleavage and polyadenylation specificity factor subunit 6-like isoform X2 [Biomphalaria glabrata]
MAGRDLNENKRREEQRMNGPIVANVAPGSKRKEWTLLIDNLLWTTTERKVHDVISSLGVIDVIKILRYRKNGPGQQYGFLVRLGMELSAQIILERLPNRRIDSRFPRVSIASIQSFF